MKKKIIAALLTLSMAALTACGSGGGKNQPGADSGKASSAADKKGDSTEGEKILTIQIGPNTESIDPALNTSADGANYVLFLSDNLLAADQDNKPIPGLAER